MSAMAWASALSLFSSRDGLASPEPGQLERIDRIDPVVGPDQRPVGIAIAIAIAVRLLPDQLVQPAIPAMPSSGATGRGDAHRPPRAGRRPLLIYRSNGRERLGISSPQ